MKAKKLLSIILGMVMLTVFITPLPPLSALAEGETETLIFKKAGEWSLGTWENYLGVNNDSRQGNCHITQGKEYKLEFDFISANSNQAWCVFDWADASNATKTSCPGYSSNDRLKWSLIDVFDDKNGHDCLGIGSYTANGFCAYPQRNGAHGEYHYVILWDTVAKTFDITLTYGASANYHTTWTYPSANQVADSDVLKFVNYGVSDAGYSRVKDFSVYELSTPEVTPSPTATDRPAGAAISTSVAGDYYEVDLDQLFITGNIYQISFHVKPVALGLRGNSQKDVFVDVSGGDITIVNNKNQAFGLLYVYKSDTSTCALGLGDYNRIGNISSYESTILNDGIDMDIVWNTAAGTANITVDYGAAKTFAWNPGVISANQTYGRLKIGSDTTPVTITDFAVTETTPEPTEAPTSEPTDRVLVDGIDIDVDHATATALMRNLSDEDKNAVILLAQYDENGRLLDADTASCTVPAHTASAVSGTALATALKPNTKKLRSFVWNSLSHMAPLAAVKEVGVYSDSLKVLAIGNSFSVDALEYFYQIADDYGIEDIKIGNLYIGSCSLQTHWNNARNNSASYTYYKNTIGTFTSSTSSILSALQDEDWDIIVLQQVSGLSGQPDSYEPYLTNLKNYVDENKTNPNAKLAWHMTWAYQANSTHSDFARYNNSQSTMYQAIVSTVKSQIVPDGDFTYIIPSGTAIQNMRTSYIGDNMTRDGFHMSIPLGRYVAALTWFKTFTGASLGEIDYAPSGVSNLDKETAREAVNNACGNPFRVTASSYQTNSMDLSNYTELSYTPTLSSYWYSTNNLNRMTGLSQYASTDRFDKNDLPVGSIIMIQDGWQYRPEGWVSLDQLATSRPANVTTKYVEVTEVWWGDYNYRAFNISKLSGTAVTSADAVKAAFKIYIPKS